MNIVKQSLVLLLSFLIIFIWELTPLADYTIQALAFLAFLLLLTSILKKGKKGFQPNSLIGDNPYWSVFLLNTLVFLLVFATGGINSSLFLLLYFVGFGIAFVFEPSVVFVYLLGTTAVLMPEILQNDVVGNAIKSATILIVGPLAYFFGKGYKKEEEEDAAIQALEEEAHQKASAIEKSVVEVLEAEKDIISEESVTKLKTVLKTSDTLREETKQDKLRKKVAYIKKNDLILLLTFCFFLLTSVKASAFTMSNLDFILDMGNLNSFAGKKSNSEFTLTDTGGQLAPGLYSGPNYKVRAGFQYIYSIIAFRFTISSLFIDFGVLTPTTPVIRNNILTISNGSAHGYQVTAFENHQLLVPSSGQIIPNTTCDAGTCTTTVSAAWTNILTYGFGYRCDNVSGTDCASGFSDATYYKQFADSSASQTPQAVMEGANVGRNKQVQITYKVNISGTQAAGSYTNVITYIATPTF